MVASFIFYMIVLKMASYAFLLECWTFRNAMRRDSRGDLGAGGEHVPETNPGSSSSFLFSFSFFLPTHMIRLSFRYIFGTHSQKRWRQSLGGIIPLSLREFDMGIRLTRSECMH